MTLTGERVVGLTQRSNTVRRPAVAGSYPLDITPRITAKQGIRRAGGEA